MRQFKTFLFFSIFSILLSCNVYKNGQTVDDVYFSPALQLNQLTNHQDGNGYLDLSDRYLRMKSSNRRWFLFDEDFIYWNNSPWNNQFFFNPWYRERVFFDFGYNPYFNSFSPIYYNTAKRPSNYRPRTINLNNYSNNNTGGGSKIYTNTPSYRSSPLRTFETISNNKPNNSTNTSTNTAPVRTFTRGGGNR